MTNERRFPQRSGADPLHAPSVVAPLQPQDRREIMKATFSPRQVRNALFGALATLAPIMAAQAVSPLGFEIPPPGSPGHRVESAMSVPATPRGVSPLGWEIPPPGPRGAQGPIRMDTVADTMGDWNSTYHLGGIGGAETN
jgi:hypothetical protein